MIQFNEKDMVNDYLEAINASLTEYSNYIAHADNEQLRQTLIQLRNADEVRQRTIYQYAIQKGYYQPASPANPNEIQQIKSQLSQPQ
ncbi:spore coat protein [Bacillus alveayuensis]|jgi:spore coat protein CotF|uniref:Spore coat protein CotF n=1 Tax=Aeribacillus alveayuensis TaxID=279215 RepID=A0ABT9VQ04_9BACI|nr:spore coat protein [Bacillus alveayuensis]MDQ0162964.1 spore coat protein CotF [Bacillus alveayuensis]